MLRRVLRIFAIAIGVVLVLLAAVLAYYSWRPITTEPIAGADAIAELADVPIGGVAQSLSLRGTDRKAPVLLYLHAGPGMAAMAMADAFSPGLEKHFVVVQWDQRGAGKSCIGDGLSGKDFIETLVSDAAEVVAYLRGRFGARPVYVVGHASGAAIGAILAHRHPELVAGLVMVTPLVDTARNEQKVLEWVRARAAEVGDTRLVADLAALSVPYNSQEDFLRVQDHVAAFGGETTNPKGLMPVLRHALRAREYSLHNKLSYVRCIQDSLDAAWESIWKLHLAETAPSIQAPVWVFLGGKDRSISADVVREYYDLLQAPKKEILVLEDAAHYPMFEQPEHFDRELISRLTTSK